MHMLVSYRRFGTAYRSSKSRSSWTSWSLNIIFDLLDFCEAYVAFIPTYRDSVSESRSFWTSWPLNWDPYAVPKRR
jgi:hypothetical protein